MRLTRWLAGLAMTAMAWPLVAVARDDSDDAARDLSPEMAYNRPGATRAEYVRDWLDCRMIARGAPPPSSSFPRSSSGAPAVGGIAPALLGAALGEGTERRFSRRTCLQTRGWQPYTLSAAEKTRVQAMPDAERAAYFDRIVGAAAVPGTPYGRTNFTTLTDPALGLDGLLPGPGSVYAGKKADLTAPIVPGANEAVVILAYRRPDRASAGRKAMVQIIRYDRARRELAFPQAQGDTTTYLINADSADRKAIYEVQILRLTAGDYVIGGTTTGAGLRPNTNCFGAPLFHAGAGETVYIGDFVPFWGSKLAAGGWMYGMGYSRHIDDARTTLAARQPALAAAMRQAEMYNLARYTCVAGIMDRWDLPGLAPLP